MQRDSVIVPPCKWNCMWYENDVATVQSFVIKSRYRCQCCVAVAKTKRIGCANEICIRYLVIISFGVSARHLIGNASFDKVERGFIVWPVNCNSAHSNKCRQANKSLNIKCTCKWFIVNYGRATGAHEKKQQQQHCLSLETKTNWAAVQWTSANLRWVKAKWFQDKREFLQNDRISSRFIFLLHFNLPLFFHRRVS